MKKLKTIHYAQNKKESQNLNFKNVDYVIKPL